MKVWIIGGLLFVAGMAACAGEVNITAETASGTQGAGGAGSSASSASSSVGTGGPGPGLSKVVTADTDIGQYVSITIPFIASPDAPTKVVEGPFFITDVISPRESPLSIVQGNDCSVSEDKLIPVVIFYDQFNAVKQVHGLRLPILAGQSVCAVQSANFKVTVLGFKPY